MADENVNLEKILNLQQLVEESWGRSPISNALREGLRETLKGRLPSQKKRPKTSLKKMGLKGQPKPELAMTEERKENRLSGQVSYNFFRSEGEKVPSFNKFLSDNQPEQFKSNNLIHRQRLIDLYGEKEGRKFWKADVEADHDLWIKKQKEIWGYAKKYEKSAATKDTKKAKK
tara:strand:+ start:334 stop:852 length:519 start_codon:yes stop_codon:yes gene_type:complete